MDEALLPLLACPACRGTLQIAERAAADGARLSSGTLRCDSCRRRYPVREGILDLLAGSPRLINPAQLTNYLAPAAWAYERVWRWWSLSLLSRRRFPLAEEVQLMLDHLQPRPGEAYLDLACSNGLYARALAGASPHSLVVGLDHSYAMLREASRRSRQYKLAISYIRADASQLPFRIASIQGLACGGSLNEFMDVDHVLVQARRSLRSGGRSFWMQAVQAPTRPGRITQRLLSVGGLNFPAAAELRDRFERAGFQILIERREGAVQILSTE